MKYATIGLLLFLALYAVVNGAIYLALLFVFDEEPHIPIPVLIAIDLIVAAVAFIASLYLASRWKLTFWHRLTLLGLFACIGAASVSLALMTRPPMILSREIEQDGQVVKYAMSDPGLGRKTEGWTIRKERDRPIDQIDDLARHEVCLYYYWWSDDNVAMESLLASLLIFACAYFPGILRSLMKRATSPDGSAREKGLPALT